MKPAFVRQTNVYGPLIFQKLCHLRNNKNVPGFTKKQELRITIDGIV